MNIKKLLITGTIALSALLPLSACTSDETYSKEGLRELEKYIVEVDEYTELDYKYADKYYADNYDNWGGGCSAISKMVDGHRLVGRNMDLNISNKNAYIIRTNSGKYKTLGLMYTFRDISPDYDVYKSKGITNQFRKVLPFMCDDVLNEEGLHIEINMRHSEYWPSGGNKFDCEHTNKDSDKRVYLFEIPRYISENCKSVEEAKEYVKTLDVYSKKNYWGYCFLVSDAQGASSVLEFSSNTVSWIDEATINECSWLDKYGENKAICQTNFYLNQSAYPKEDIKTGEGRFITLQQGIGDVHSKLDMYNLMKKIQYSSFYLPYDECKDNHFDPRSELVGEKDGLTYDVVFNPENEEMIRQALNAASAEYKAQTRQQLQDQNYYWESSFTEVIDTTEKSIIVRMFENEDRIYRIDFEGTQKSVGF